MCYCLAEHGYACPRAETWNLFVLNMWFPVLFFKLSMFQLPPTPFQSWISCLEVGADRAKKILCCSNAGQLLKGPFCRISIGILFSLCYPLGFYEVDLHGQWDHYLAVFGLTIARQCGLFKCRHWSQTRISCIFQVLQIQQILQGLHLI